MVQEIMKPLVYYDFKEINDGEVAINKKRLEEILEEVYQAGYADLILQLLLGIQEIVLLIAITQHFHNQEKFILLEVQFQDPML